MAPGAGYARWLRTDPGRFLPGLVVAITFVVALHRAGVGDRTVLWFLVVQAVAYALPGMLAWRVLRGGRDPAIADLVLGTIAFHALSVPWYVVVRWAGVPRLVWLLPVATVAGAVLVARRRGSSLLSSQRLPVWCAWNASAAISLGVAMIGAQLPVEVGPLRRWPGTDNPFLLSLAGDLKHHMPGAMPFVTGQKLHYHWFTFADIASTSWLGGQELDVLTFALVPMGMFTLALAAFGLLGWKVTGKPAGGVLALWLAVLVGSVNPLGGFNGYVIDGTFLNALWLASVTQGYAEVLGIGLLFVVVDLLRSGRRREAVSWALFVVVSVVLSGAKASFVPVLGAGALVALVVAYRRGRGWRTVLALGTVLAADLVFAQVALFGGESQGLKLGPHSSLDLLAVSIGLGHVDTGGILLVLAFVVAGWLLPLIVLGAAVLRGGRERVREDLVSWWLLGMVASSMLATLALTHAGFSQYFFLRSGLPFAYLGVAACLLWLWAVASLRLRVAGGAAAILGLGACFVLRGMSEPEAMPRSITDLTQVLVATLVLVALVAAAAAGVTRPGGRKVAALLVAGSFTLGMGAARTVDYARRVDDQRPQQATGRAVIPLGGIEAARYVRAHSDPDELFATNEHCRLPRTTPCRTTAHWMSAWTERRAVIEGWGYTPRANASGDSIPEATTSPYWDPELLALNDRVFLNPSREALDALIRRFPVRWLLVDRRFPADVAGLRELLPVSRRFGQTIVFDVGPVH